MRLSLQERLVAAATRAGVSMQIGARGAIDAAEQEDKILGLVLTPTLLPGTGWRSAWRRPATPASSPKYCPGPARWPRCVPVDPDPAAPGRGIDGDPPVRDYSALVVAHERHPAELPGQSVHTDPADSAAALLHAIARLQPLQARNDIFAWPGRR